MKAEIQPKKMLGSTSKLRGVPDTNLQEYPSNVKGDTVEKVHFTSSNMSLTTDRWQPN
jgi:hypothetical protein